MTAETLGVNEPQLPRRRKLPHRFDDSLSGGDFAPTPKVHFKQYYFDVIDLSVNCTKDRFDQPDYRIYCLLETLLLKACRKEELEDLRCCLRVLHGQFQEGTPSLSAANIWSTFPGGGGGGN